MQAGSVIADKYRLECLLGRAGLRTVWRAEHLALGLPVALHFLDRAMVAGPQAMARFRSAMRSLSALQSAQIVHVLDVDAVDGVPYIVMELVGESLAQRIERVGALSPALTATIVAQVAYALTRAHERDHAYRYLKADNIFFAGECDEEFAKVDSLPLVGIDPATGTWAVMGAPYGMALEHIGRARKVDFADLSALAIVAYQCLTGCKPFDADSSGALATQSYSATPPAPSTVAAVPPGFDAWFARATAPRIADRFQSASDLAYALRQVCRGTREALDARTGAPHGLVARSHEGTSARRGSVANDGVDGSVALALNEGNVGRGYLRWAPWAVAVVVMAFATFMAIRVAAPGSQAGTSPATTAPAQTRMGRLQQPHEMTAVPPPTGSVGAPSPAPSAR